MDQQTTSEQQRVPTAAPDAGSPPESPAPAASQQPTQTWGDRALRLLTSLLSGALVGLAAGALVLVVGGLGLRFVFVTMLEGGESALNLGFLLAIGCLLPATLLTALIVGLSALAPIHIVRSRIAAAGSLQAQRGDRAFSISCLSIVAIGVCITALGVVAYQVFRACPGRSASLCSRCTKAPTAISGIATGVGPPFGDRPAIGKAWGAMTVVF
ncbi:MAG: hypothetical protein ACE5FI_02165 [Anaerolineales bacterium]